MSIIALILIVALLIPIIGIVVDSPIGRAIARRMEGPQAAPPGLAELAKKVELLEAGRLDGDGPSREADPRAGGVVQDCTRSRGGNL